MSLDTISCCTENKKQTLKLHKKINFKVMTEHLHNYKLRSKCEFEGS